MRRVKRGSAPPGSAPPTACATDHPPPAPLPPPLQAGVPPALLQHRRPRIIQPSLRRHESRAHHRNSRWLPLGQLKETVTPLLQREIVSWFTGLRSALVKIVRLSSPVHVVDSHLTSSSPTSQGGALTRPPAVHRLSSIIPFSFSDPAPPGADRRADPSGVTSSGRRRRP